ncbi:MAG: ATP-binding protein [Planctomycetota bacterium]
MSASAQTSELPSQTSPASRLRLMYATAIGLILAATCLSQLSVQSSIAGQSQDAAIINLAGRQRMLSQKIAKTALAIHQSDQGQRPKYVEEMLSLESLWSESQSTLRYGSKSLPVASQSQQILKAFEELQPTMDLMLEACQRLRQQVSSKSAYQEPLEQILQHERIFLPAMHAIVGMLESESNAKHARLKKIEFGLMILTFAILGFEVIFIFEPAAKTIATQFREVAESSRRLASAAATEDHNHALRQEVERRIEAERKLRDALEQAESANDTKSLFLSSTSAELREPLKRILTQVELIDVEHSSREDRVQHLREIEGESNRLLRSLNDILDVARVEAGQLDIRNEPCDLSKVLRESFSVLRINAEEMSVLLELNVRGELPERLVTDADRIHQVLLKLVDNALKFTKRGLVNVEIEYDRNFQTGLSAEDCGILEVRVQDTGIGIAPENLERILRPFEQGRQLDPASIGGMGLGLSVCQAIIDSVGGTLSIESKENHCTCVDIRWPMACVESSSDERTQFNSMTEVSVARIASSDAEASSDSEVPEPVVNDSESSVDPKKPMTILVCDDEKIFRDLYRLLLRLYDVNVITAVNGKEAVEIIEREDQRIDAVLLDMQMPVMNGYVAAARLRDMGFENPIVALTAHRDRQRCMDAGCSGYMRKPIDSTTFATDLMEMFGYCNSTNSPPPGAGLSMAAC